MSITGTFSLLLCYLIFHPMSMLHGMEAKSLLEKPNFQSKLVSLMPFSDDNLTNMLTNEISVPADATAGPNITRNFLALPDNNVYIPPDTDGAAGPNHLMTMLNTNVRIQDKNGNGINTQTLAQFWANAPGPAGTRFDPRVVYDRESGRWFAICGTSGQSVSSGILLAVSTTSDPTGAWDFHHIDAHPDNTYWADYPNIGFNSTWVAITAVMFQLSGFTVRRGMWVINKHDLITGQGIQPKRFFNFDAAGDFEGGPVYSGTMAPCVTFGSESKLYIVDNGDYVYNGNLLLRLSEITGPVDDPIWQPTPGSTWDSTGLFPTNMSIGGQAWDAEQPFTDTRIETDVLSVGGNRLLNAVFRNNKIWTTHHSVVPRFGPWNSLHIIWYEIRPSSMPNALVQSGIITAPSNVYYYYPSIAVNSREDILLGFTRSSPSIYAQAAYTGRRGTDPLGYMDTISVLKLGEDTYVKDFGGGRVRWGDYSATVVDPTNDIEMWTIQEYAEQKVGSSSRWGTWWGLACECIAKSGDATADGNINLSDIIYIQNYVFKAGPAPSPKCRGDATGDGNVLLTDIVYLINYVFKVGPAPVKTCQCCV